MSILNSKEFSKSLSEGRIEKAYLFMGDENYLKRHYYKELEKTLLKDGLKEFNLTLIKAEDISAQTIYDAVMSAPVLSDKRLVVVKDLNPSDITPELKVFFKEIMPILPQTAVFAVYQETVEMNEKLKSTAEMINIFDKYGAVLQFNTPGIPELSRWAERHLASREKTADQAVIKYFLSVTDNDMTNLVNEMEKLCHYAEDQRITKDHVDEIVTKSVDAVVFRLTDALFSGEYSSALEILKQLFRQKVDETLILGVIAREIISLYKVSAAIKEGIGERETAKIFGIRDFLVRRYAGICRNLDTAALKKCLTVCLDADYSIKNENRDKSLIIEEMIGNIINCLEKSKGGKDL